MAPGRVCKKESKEHSKGEKGTEFSRCVKLVAQQRREERRAARAAATLSSAAQAVGKPEDVPKGKGPGYEPASPPPPGPKAGLPAQAKAYGRYCKGKSKEHVKGEKGTEFSRCVKAMAKAAANDAAPREACKGLSKKHVKGEKGRVHRCVKTAAQLRKEQRKRKRSSRLAAIVPWPTIAPPASSTAVCPGEAAANASPSSTSSSAWRPAPSAEIAAGIGRER